MGVSTTDENAQPVTESRRRRSIFRRGEDALAHTVYGLILTLATIGELIHHEASAEASIAWLIGAGAVLLALAARRYPFFPAECRGDEAALLQLAQPLIRPSDVTVCLGGLSDSARLLIRESKANSKRGSLSSFGSHPFCVTS